MKVQVKTRRETLFQNRLVHATNQHPIRSNFKEENLTWAMDSYLALLDGHKRHLLDDCRDFL